MIAALDLPVASHRPIDLLEPLAGMQGAFACSPGALSSWATNAAAGRRCIYARGQRIGGTLLERARMLARSGAIQINQVRSAVDRTMFDHVATRTARPIVADPIVIDQLPQRAIDVLDLLERCAARGMPCPTNNQISATLVGLTPRHISQVIYQLREAGLLRVDIVNTRNGRERTITIVATGERLSPAGSAGRG